MEQLLVDRIREWSGPWSRLALSIEAVVDVLKEGLMDRGARTVVLAKTLGREGIMNGWLQDVRYGIRSLMRRPGFTTTAALTLALGVGANVAIFSVVHAVLLEPLPYPDADRLVSVYSEDATNGDRGAIDHPDLKAWEGAVDGLQVVGFSGSRPTLTGFGDPVALYGARVTGGLLTVLGTPPVMGRDIAPADDQFGGPAVLVVSHAFWTGRLGSDPDVIGRSLQLSGTSWEVVGVAPEGVDFPSGAEFWSARRHDPDGCGHGCRIMSGLGRIAPETSIESVRAQLDASSELLADQFPDSHRDEQAGIEPLLSSQTEDVRAGLWILLGAVGMVMLIACANVANLMLVRASERAGDVALRATLGASRMRIARQLVTESLILSMTAGAAGIALAWWGVDVLVSWAPEGIPRLDSVGVDPTVLGFAGLLVVTVTVLFGLIPALQASRGELTSTLGEGRRTSGSRWSGASRSALLTFEVALSLSLLLGTGLLLRTLGEIRTADMGFATERVERFRLSVPGSTYPVESMIRFQEDLEERLAALPGVEAVGMGFGAPLASGSIGSSAQLLDRPRVDAADEVGFAIRPSTPGFLEASGTRLIQGRWFTRADQRDALAVAVINRSAAQAYWPDTDPIGKRVAASISWGFDDDPERTIVGIVEDVRTESATMEPLPALYFPNAQFGANSFYVTIALTPGVSTVVPEARAVVSELDATLAITLVERIEDVVAEELAGTRFYLMLIAGFSVLALLLAGVGLYGVVAYAVSRRTREIGIRIALGARLNEITSMVVREGARPALLGVVLGLALSRVWTGLIGSVLYGVTPNDPLVIGGAVVILVSLTVAATVLPALRAARVSPVTALRAD